MEGAGIPTGEPRPRRRRLRRILAFLVLGTVAAATGAVLTRSWWAAPLLADFLTRRAREDLGAEVTIERIGGSWWGDLTLEGVTWRSAEGPLRRADQLTIELSWSPAVLWGGELRPEVQVRGRGLELEPGSGSDDGSSGEWPEIERLRIELDDVVLRLADNEPLRLDTLRVDGALRGAEARVAALEAVSAGNRVTLEQASLRLDAPDALELARSLRGDVRLSLPDAAPLGAALLPDLPLRSAEVALTVVDGRASLGGEVVIAGGRLAIARGELVLPPSGEPVRETLLNVDLDAELADLAQLSALLGTELRGSWNGSIDVRGPLRAPTGRLEGQGEGLEIDGTALGSIDLVLETDGKRATFERCRVSGPDLEIALRGDVRLGPLELIDVALDAQADAPVLAPLVPFPIERVSLHARLEGPPTAPRGEFELGATGIELGATSIDDVAARGTVDGDVLELAELHLKSGEARAEVSGRLRRDGTSFEATLATLWVQWGETRIDLEHGARVVFGGERLEVDGVELRSSGEQGEGRAAISLVREEGLLRAALEFERYEAGSLLAAFLGESWSAGRIDGRVEGELGGPAPRLEVELDLVDWVPAGDWPPLDASLQAEYDGASLDLKRLVVSHEHEEGARLEGALRIPFPIDAPLPLADGPVALALTLETGDLASALRRLGLEPDFVRSGDSHLEAEVTGTWAALAGRVGVRAREVTVGRGPRARACDLEAELVLDERVRIERAVFSDPSGSITLSGDVDVAPDLTRMTEPGAGRELLGAPVSLEARVDLQDLSWIAGLFDDTLRRVSGRAEGAVRVTGSLRYPELAGELAWNEGEVRLASSAPPMRAIEARLRFEDDIVHVDSLSGEIGGAPLHLNGTLDPFGPYPRLEVWVKGENVLLARDVNLIVRADADLHVKGTLSQLHIDGDLLLAEGRYRGQISPLEELVRAGQRGGKTGESEPISISSTGLLADAVLEVHVGARRNFVYRTNLLEAELRPDAMLLGTGERPTLEGPVYVDEAGLQLPSGKLLLESGVLTFRREAPMEPDVALTASMRVQRHDLRVVIAGSLDDEEEPEIVLSSSPPLPMDDLWILLLTGQLPTDRWQDRSSQAMEALAVFLARDGFVRWFGGDPSDTESLLERFEIDVGASTSVSGQPTGKVLFYLKPRSTRTGRATYLSAEIDEYDRVNYAFGIVFRPR